MSSGPLLMTADAGAYGALGDGGQPVWRRAAQLRAAIDTRLGKRHAELFAIPQEQGSNIEWRAPFDGTSRRRPAHRNYFFSAGFFSASFLSPAAAAAPAAASGA